jgi:hypothetical protein
VAWRSGDVGGCIQDVLHATACDATVGDLPDILCRVYSAQVVAVSQKQNVNNHVTARIVNIQETTNIIYERFIFFLIIIIIIIIILRIS